MTIEDEILRRLMQLLQMPVRKLQSTKKLSDRTRIAGTTWANLKDEAIDDDYDYEKQDWWVSIFIMLLFNILKSNEAVLKSIYHTRLNAIYAKLTSNCVSAYDNLLF